MRRRVVFWGIAFAVALGSTVPAYAWRQHGGFVGHSGGYAYHHGGGGNVGGAIIGGIIGLGLGAAIASQPYYYRTCPVFQGYQQQWNGYGLVWVPVYADQPC